MAFITVYYEKPIINTSSNKHLLINTMMLFRMWVAAFCLTYHASSAAYELGHSPDSGFKNIKLSQQAKDAVDNGITLILDCTLKTSKKIGFISWPEKKENHTFSLTRHSLSNRYLVRTNNAITPKNFHTIGEATSYIIEQSQTFFNLYSNDKDSAQMRLSLNKFKLPGPIRLNAFTASHWNFDTGWILWSSEI